MTETDWTEGEGLTDNGEHDTDWNGRDTIGITMSRGEWRVRILWGSCWGHLVFGIHEDFDTAMAQAVRSALDEGCPPGWLPHPLTLSAAEASE
jgi:hypothetical protein